MAMSKGRVLMGVLLGGIVLGVATLSILRADEPAFRRTEDVIYGRKFGSTLTMDVFQPKGPSNGLGIVNVVSGGWYSAREMINPDLMRFWTDRGYTAFAVVHGSQPKYAIPDAVADMNRAVRYIRHHAREYGVDPDRLGVTGSSAGGHLSLMLGTAGGPGDPKAPDPVDRESSRVAAVACFFPPTDFLNYGKAGEAAIGEGTLKDFAAPFDFMEWDPERRRFRPVTDRARREAIARDVSPVNHASKESAPTLIAHGDADTLVPIQQAEVMVAKLKEVGVDARLMTQPGGAHGWAGMDRDLVAFAEWFDAHLKPGPRP